MLSGKEAWMGLGENLGRGGTEAEELGEERGNPPPLAEDRTAAEDRMKWFPKI